MSGDQQHVRGSFTLLIFLPRMIMLDIGSLGFWWFDLSRWVYKICPVRFDPEKSICLIFECEFKCYKVKLVQPSKIVSNFLSVLVDWDPGQNYIFQFLILTLSGDAVTMQAQRTAPSDMQCKDKFLIQCTVVPFGISEEEIPPSMVKIPVHHLNLLLYYCFLFSFCFFFQFNKDNGKYIEECKLKVVLVSLPQSPVLQPANGISKQGASIETSMQQEKFPSGVENLPPIQTVSWDYHLSSLFTHLYGSAFQDLAI